MKADEKLQLLTMFDSERKWCKGSEARNQHGDPIRYDDPTAVAWDIVGGMCHLFGWRRASSLFRQMHNSMAGKRVGLPPNNEEIAAMAALIDFNDAGDTTYEGVVEVLAGVPVSTNSAHAESEMPACG